MQPLNIRVGLSDIYLAHMLAPEILQGKPYNEKVDVYSFGILMYGLILVSSRLHPRWELFSECLPFMDGDLCGFQLLMPIIQGKRPDMSLLKERTKTIEGKLLLNFLLTLQI